MGGLDEATTNMVLDNLAKFHAASLAVREHAPEKLKGVEDNLWATNEEIATMSKSGLGALIEEASDWKDFPKEYVQRLIDLQPVVVQRMRAALEVNEKDLNILSHGDCWINNMMIYPDKTPVEM